MRLRGGAESRLSSMLSSTADTHCLTAPYPLQHSTTLYSSSTLYNLSSTPPLSVQPGAWRAAPCARVDWSGDQVGTRVASAAGTASPSALACRVSRRGMRRGDTRQADSRHP